MNMKIRVQIKIIYRNLIINPFHIKNLSFYFYQNYVFYNKQDSKNQVIYMYISYIYGENINTIKRTSQ